MQLRTQEWGCKLMIVFVSRITSFLDCQRMCEWLLFIIPIDVYDGEFCNIYNVSSKHIMHDKYSPKQLISLDTHASSLAPAVDTLHLISSSPLRQMSLFGLNAIPAHSRDRSGIDNVPYIVHRLQGILHISSSSVELHRQNTKTQLTISSKRDIIGCRSDWINFRPHYIHKFAHTRIDTQICLMIIAIVLNNIQNKSHGTLTTILLHYHISPPY